MKLVYSHLQKLLPILKDVSIKTIAEKLTYLGHFNDGLESIDGENVISLEIRQNRGEALGYFGLAKDLSVLYPPFSLPLVQLPQIPETPNTTIEIRSPDVYRIQSLVISDLKNTSSPQWLVDFLKCHQVNSINTLVDLTNYIMFLYGIPCHAFDTKKIGQPLVWQNNTKFTEFTTLDGTKLNLNQDNLIITSDNKVDSLSFIGGKACAIDLNTTETLLEMAVYNRSRVKSDSRSLKTITEASIRLDKELDSQLIPIAFNHLVSLVLEYCGGHIKTSLFDYYPTKLNPISITFNPNKVSQVAGVAIPTDFCLSVLEKLDCHINPDKSITPPSYRKDLNIEDDLVEEVIRFYGYDKIPKNVPLSFKDISNITPPIIRLIDSLKNNLANLGYDEIRSWPLVKQPIDTNTVITTQNSINSDYPYLRQSIIQSLKSQLSSYNRYKVPNPQFFETGKIFFQQNSKYIEKYSLGLYHPNLSQLKKDLIKLNLSKVIFDGNFAEIILDDLDFSQVNLGQIQISQSTNSVIELTKQIVTLDANVIYLSKQEPKKLIDEYKQKIGDNLWDIAIIDIFENKKDNSFKYTFRVSYFNLSSAKAKQLHLTTFNLADQDTIDKLELLTIDKDKETEPLYYKDMYQDKTIAKVINICKVDNKNYVVLDQSVFFPEGGGQPGDIGIISLKTENINVVNTIYKNGQILHQISSKAEILKIGDTVNLKIDWQNRYKYMKIHSAGHLLHEVIMTNFSGLSPLKGYHHEQSYLIYQGIINPDQLHNIQDLTNQQSSNSLNFECRYTNYEELSRMSPNIPKNLPRNKKLRLLKIGNYPAMADGGVHVKNTKEIGKIIIDSIKNLDNNQTQIFYKIETI